MTRLALVGYGRIAPKHLEAFRAQGAEFVACCNRSPEGRQRAETEGRIPRTYARIDEMLDRERPQGVVCCASMHHIYGAALEILGRGIPTLLEKPPGTSLDEYNRLCDMTQASGTPVMVAMNRRHYSVVRKAVEDAGGFDAITAVSVEWSEDPRHLLSRGFSVEQVARMVFGNTLHGLDLITYLAGAVDRPAIVGLDFGQPLRWMMGLQGVSTRGALVTFNSTWDSPGRWRLSFTAASRRYLFAPLETCQVSEFGVKEMRAIEPDDVDARFKPGFFDQARAFLQTVISGKAHPLHNLESARPAMLLADKLTNACCRAGDAQSPFVSPSAEDAKNNRIDFQPDSIPVKSRRLRVVALADSMSMVRDAPRVYWEDTWPARLTERLRDRGIDADVINCGSRARTADQLLGLEFDEHVFLNCPDVLVLQVGVVDCAPRIFSRRERDLLNRRFVPARVREWMIRRRSAQRAELLRTSDPLRKVYTPPRTFVACLESFRYRLAGLEHPPRVIVLPIVYNPTVMDEKSPGYRGNVDLYNGLLRDFAQAGGFEWLEPGELVRESEIHDSFAGDGYHFSPLGCRRCARVLSGLIAPDGDLVGAALGAAGGAAAP